MPSRIVSLLALTLLAACSPEESNEVRDRLVFPPGEDTQVRRVRVDASGGNRAVQVTADVPIDIGSDDGRRPVVLSVVPEAGSESILDDYGPGYVAGTESSVAGRFEAIDCPADQACSEVFEFVFTRPPGDLGQTLEFDWSIAPSIQFDGLERDASPPPGGYVVVSISP